MVRVEDNEKTLTGGAASPQKRSDGVPRREPGPLDDPDGSVVDSRYAPGWWETLCAGEHGVTLLGCSPEPSAVMTHDVQSGAFLTFRSSSGHFTTMVGGGA